MLHPRSPRVALVLLGLLLCVALPALAQPAPELRAHHGVWQYSPPRAAASSSSGPAALSNYQYLPALTASGAPASVTWYGRLGDSRSGPATQFSYGITGLEYEVRVVGAAGASYREEWSLDGRRTPQLDSQGNVPASPATFTNTILYSTNQPLPRGIYQLRVLIADYPAAVVSVQIQ